MKSDPHKSILVIVTGFLIVGFIFPAGSKYWVTTAAAIGTLGLANRYFRKWILAAWEMIGIVMGWINSRIILSIVFTFFLVPIGFLYKLIKGDLLFLKKSHLILFSQNEIIHMKRRIWRIPGR